jgi:hypothetical protein
VVGLLLGELVGGEFISWPEPDSFGGNRKPAGIRRNPKGSKGIQRNLVEIQEFLSRRNSYKKIPVKVAENKNFQDPSKTTFL